MMTKLSNRRMLYALFLGYSITITILYSLPIGLENEWYAFYSYLDKHQAIPYIDVREGYPPLGFLIYMPLYYAFYNNSTAFFYAFRALNGSLLIGALLLLYLISKSIFNEKRALKFASYYALLPSVIIANTYSNDIVALFPAALAIYMIIKKRPLLCGFLLGLATLGKGFPILLLIPALIEFTDIEDRFKLVSATMITLLSASLPFIIVNPFTYMSTFTHHASRGPWETLWALIDGYYSHGGLLHPYFDKFFYHFNLLKIYPLSPYDHAIYKWRFGWMPDLLTLGQIVIIVVLSLAYKRWKSNIVSLCGFLYISNMFFFKGYSTQFSVSTQFYTLLAAADKPLLFLVPLELSHIIQMFSWFSQGIAPEFLRNEHLLLLVSAIMMRSVVFGSLVWKALVNSRVNYFKQITAIIKHLFSYLKLLKDKIAISLLLVIFLFASLNFVALYGYVTDDTKFRSFDGDLNITLYKWSYINLNGLNEGDQVIVRLLTNTSLSFRVVSGDSVIEVERGTVNPYNFKGSFNETILFFRAGSESCRLMLKMKHPSLPFRMEESGDDLSITARSDGSTLILNLYDKGLDGHGSFIRMIYPCETYVGEDFSLHLKYKVVSGEVSTVLLDVFDDTDEWLYSFNASEDFILKPDSVDVYGYSNLFKDRISLIAIVISLNNGSSATIRLEGLSVNGSDSFNVNFHVKNSELLHYKVFIEHDFKPSIQFTATLILSTSSGIVAIYYFYKKLKRFKTDECAT